METSNVSKSSEFLWTTFYTSFLGDVSGNTPEINVATELRHLSEGEELWGTSLYLKVLPELGKALEASLSSCEKLKLSLEVETFHMLNGFPIFLSESWKRLFTLSGDGKLLPKFDIRDRVVDDDASYHVWLLRQFLLAFAKVTDVEPDCDVEEEIYSFRQRALFPPVLRTTRTTNRVIRVARDLLKHVLCQEDENGRPDSSALCAPLTQWIEDPFGLHGPGAVAGGEQGLQKWDFREIRGIDTNVLSYYCAEDIRRLYHGYDATEFRGVFPPVSRCSRLAIVPKDFRGHRLICIEPKELQFAQQGIMRVLYQHVHAHFLTRRSIDFTDQEKSQRLSRDLHYATIDLKDASDRISVQLARLILPTPFFELVGRYRSSHINLPLEHIHSSIYLTMGNALCFPVETLTFWALSLAAMMVKDGFSGRLEKIPDFVRSHKYVLRVFGDDIIVPRTAAGAVIRSLEECGLVVNRGKTCVDGLSRESCGSWFYNQDDVTITRFKTTRITSTRDWIGLLEQARCFQSLGMTGTSQSICDFIDHMHPVPYDFAGFPARAKRGVTIGQPGGFQSPRINGLSGTFYRYNVELQRLEFRLPSLRYEGANHDLRGDQAFYAYFTNQATNALSQGNLTVKWDWVEVRR